MRCSIRAALRTFVLMSSLASGAAGAARAAEPVSESCRSAYRDRRITLVVPYAAGGGYDQYARAMVAPLQRASGARVAVSNIVGAGGEIGAKAIADGDAVNPRLGVFEPGLVVETVSGDEASLARFVPLALITTERQAWNARPGFDPGVRRERPLVASVTDVQANLVEVALVSHALGIPLRFTGGYRGSADRLAAVMRGEVDITANSLTTAAKAARSGDIAPVLLISDGPDPAFPGVPFLAGRGGLVERMTAGRPAAERAEAMRVAAQAVDGSRSLRAVFVSARVPETARSCLASLVWEVLSGEEFGRAAATVGRPVRPEDGKAAQAAIDRMLEGLRANRDLLRRLMHDATR